MRNYLSNGMAFKISFLILLFVSGNSFSQARKIIDVHFHTRSAGDYGNPPPENPVTGKPPMAKSNEEIMQANYAILKQNNIVRAICSGSLLRNQDYLKLDSTLFISSLEFPDHQNNALPDTATFKALYLKKAFFVFGELGLQYNGITLADPTIEPYLRICERLGIPVAVHTGEAAPGTPYTCCPGFTIESGRPLKIEPVLLKFPRLRIQLMHMGYPFLEETKALMNVYPQVYADVSAIDWLVPVEEFHWYLKSLVIAGFGKRIMYGSDQMIWEDAIPLSIKNIEAASFLKPQQKYDIFYNNAVRFYGLK